MRTAAFFREKAARYRWLAEVTIGLDDKTKAALNDMADLFDALAAATEAEESRQAAEKGAGSEIIEGKDIKRLRDERGARGIDILTPALTAAFFCALVLLIMPGDQTGEMLERLGSTMGVW
jgi:hypothetical protein